MLQLIQFLIFLLSLLFHPLLTLSLSIRNSSTHLCHHDEKTALLQFKSLFTVNASFSESCIGFQVSYPKTRSWKRSTDCCFWQGVTCDGVAGHVTGLDLSCSGLVGAIHSNSSLFRLQHLKTLNLADNWLFPSRISPNFSNFRGLELLNLSNSDFTGKVPIEIAHLSQLISLDLSSRSIMDPGFSNPVANSSFLENFEYFVLIVSYELYLGLEMPDFDRIARNFTHLRELHLDGVKLNSAFPQTLTNLSSLTSLRLNFCNLQGAFPSGVLRLPYLQTLMVNINPNLSVDARQFNLSGSLRVVDFTMTNLSGILPDKLGSQPPALRKFSAMGCNLYGAIPSWMWNTTEEVKLDMNHFTGELPSTMNTKALSRFTGLGLSRNSLKGTIPSWLWSLPSLKSLQLGNNQFIGKLSGLFIQGNSSLESINLSMNSLSVELDIFSKFRNLSSLTLSDTNLSMSNDANSTISWPKLSVLSLSSCNLTEFPYFLRSQHTLEMLDLSYNKIQGEVPPWFRNVGKDSLAFLNISHNNLTGGLELLSWKNLIFIDLRSNSLQGPLPLPPPDTLVYLPSHNRFHGEIPSSFCNSTILISLDLSYNSLNGTLPSCFGEWSNALQFLNLQSNKFHGTIPVKFGKDCSLMSINLNNNQFEGQLPRSLARCTGLQVIDFGKNQLNDTFPHWLDTLPELQVLVLRSNNFRGTIRSNPKAEHLFPKLQILDLSRNQLSGKLPASYIENFKAMMNGSELSNKASQYIGGSNAYYHDSVVLTVKGLSLNYDRILATFTTLDLSDNKFSGDIPNSVGQLVALRGLNLSHNYLTGYIPPSLSNLTSLEFLDLSFNGLEEEIPTQLVGLTFLEDFSVAENQLTGPIPQGNQFNTFSSNAYEGNPGLCGNPLPECGEADTPHQPVPSMSEHEAKTYFDFTSISLWEVIVIGYGIGTIFGLAVGWYMLSSGKPAWFSRKVDRMEYVMVQRSKKRRSRHGRKN